MENKINLCTNEILTKIPSTAKLVFYKIAIEDANFEITPEWIEWAAELADRKSTRLNSSHSRKSRMPSSA